MINKPLGLLFCKCKSPIPCDFAGRTIGLCIELDDEPMIGEYYYCSKCHCPIRPEKMNYKTHMLKNE